jgi:hypothetical protein
MHPRRNSFGLLPAQARGRTAAPNAHDPPLKQGRAHPASKAVPSSGVKNIVEQMGCRWRATNDNDAQPSFVWIIDKLIESAMT